MFKISRSKEAVAESTGSAFISDSGIYPVKINFASVDVSSGGAKSVNFNVDFNGNPQTFYGPYVVNKNGDTNEIGAQLINKLGIIAGMDDGEDFDIQEETHKVGKDQKEMAFSVIQQFSDLPVMIRVQEEYGEYNGNLQARLVLKSFFSEDGASAQELVDGTDVGTRLALEQDKYASHITYKDGITAEDVAAWKANKSSGKKAATPTATSTAAPSRKLFG